MLSMGVEVFRQIRIVQAYGYRGRGDGCNESGSTSGIR